MSKMTVNYMRATDADITQSATITTLTVSSGITFSNSTSSTSITFVTNLTALSTSSTMITFTKQTAYLEYGVIRSFSTVTTTTVTSS